MGRGSLLQQACDFSTWEVAAGELRIQDPPQLHRELVSGQSGLFETLYQSTPLQNVSYSFLKKQETELSEPRGRISKLLGRILPTLGGVDGRELHFLGLAPGELARFWSTLHLAGILTLGWLFILCVYMNVYTYTQCL